MSIPYTLIEPIGPAVPLIVSVPHSGTGFPEELRDQYAPDLIDPPDDTDHHVHRLYDFVSALGITLVHAQYSRWVIDLNRSPDNTSLYTDGRIITDLTPTTDFSSRIIYRSPDYFPDAAEIDRRTTTYYQPYYTLLQERLEQLQSRFGQVLLWDAHSIRREVPKIHAEPFPDLILGSNDGTAAAPRLIETALEKLASADYSLSHNTPFKGGNITRHFGQPAAGIHALQLEMSKPLYLADNETDYDPVRAAALQTLLRRTLTALIKELTA